MKKILQVISWLKPYISNVIIFTLFVAGILIFYRQIAHINFHDLVVQMKTIPVRQFLLAILFTMCGYIALIGYDWSALRYIGKKLPLAFVAFTSFIGYSLSNTIGVSWLSGGTVRYRLYSRVGLSSSEIAMIIAFCVVGFGIGELLVGGMALTFHPDMLANYFAIPAWTVRSIAVGLLGFVFITLLLRSRSDGQLTWRQSTFKLPSTNILTGQLLFSMMDIAFAGAALYVLLSDTHQLPFMTFIAVFAIALVISVLSHVPGGVGVFEAVMVTAFHNTIPLEALTVALLSYRVIYYLIPFLVGVFLLIVSEGYITLKKRWSGVTQLEGGIGAVANVVSGVIPTAVSAVTFFSGVLLLVGSSISLSANNLKLLAEFFPLEIIELSHLMGGIVGMMIILLSFALWQRVRAALFLTGILFVSGAVISFVQTLDYDRALFLILALLLLVIGQHQFYRRARLFSGVFNLQGFLVTLAALAGFIWLLFFSFKSTPYQSDLWWQFTFNDQISRSLRTIVVAISTYVILYLFYALRPPKSHFELPDLEQLIRAEKIVNQQLNADANFLFTGDKYLLWGPEEKAFLMFGIQGRRWISLGDPVGEESDAYELLWKFKQQAEDNRYQAVFYQVGNEHLDWYINAGFSLFKLGEEASIDLKDFSIEGPARSKLRQSHSRAKRDGMSFSLAYPPHSPELLKQLKIISDEWLIAKKVREKGFSLGKFDEEYLSRFPLALIHEQGNLSAFANVFTTQMQQESTIDLMRHREGSSQATMEFLFIELMLKLKAEGYATFSLGMAPLYGLENRQGARKWDKFGSLIYKNGADFYNFDGLRLFKNKFKPEWKPKYLAIKQGKNPYMTMIDIASLISGNIIGVIKK
tara:strand:+ start:8303 stop:10897 length:2595 start_codon:yes stop_codon:yes gene_type:complete